jgi:hypothetical protein
MADKTIAPSIVQNLNMASDLYGDRSNIRNPYDTGVQIFTVNGSNQFVPQRSLNTHLLAGETELRPEVGTNFVATFNWSSFLPKGFASDQFYYAVTSIGLSIVSFGKVTATGSPLKMDDPTILVDRAAQGIVTALSAAPVAGDAVAVQYPGQLLGQLARATFGGAWMEYKQDGRKTSFVFDHMLNIPSVTSMNDASGIGLSLQSNRAMLPVPFLLSPRNTNQSQEVVLVHFEDANPVADLSFAATAGDEYALVYKLDFGGYFCDAQGNPAEQEFTLANARLAADYRPVGG